MRTAHLCNGLGGSLWTGAILGWQSVYALDHDQWRCDRVVAQAAAGWWPDLRVECADLEHWRPTALDGGVDCLAAGFSCRDISAAGRGAGLSGKSTGPTYAGCLRAIDAWRPAWVFMENSPRIVNLGRDVVTRDLVARRYRWRDGVIAAADVGAGHQRERWFLLAQRIDAAADADGVRQLQSDRGIGAIGGRAGDGVAEAADSDVQRSGEERSYGSPRSGQAQADAPGDRDESPADALRDRLQGSVLGGWLRETDRDAIEAAAGYCGAHHWNPSHPGVLRLVDGMAGGERHRDTSPWIAALGDAWVPLQAATAYRLLGGP